MRWTANHGSATISQVTFSTTSNSARLHRVLTIGSRDYLLTAVVVSGSPQLISNLMLVAVVGLKGLNVHCDSESTGRETGILEVASM